VHWMQCTRFCGVGLFPSWSVTPNGVPLDEQTLRAAEPLPACPQCGALARPNVLMFGDGEWDEARSYEQEVRMGSWLKGLGPARVVVVECGGGKAVPTGRHFCEAMAERFDAPLIRLNVRDPEVPRGQIGLAMGALAGLRAIDALLPEAGRVRG